MQLAVLAQSSYFVLCACAHYDAVFRIVWSMPKNIARGPRAKWLAFPWSFRTDSGQSQKGGPDVVKGRQTHSEQTPLSGTPMKCLMCYCRRRLRRYPAAPESPSVKPKKAKQSKAKQSKAKQGKANSQPCPKRVPRLVSLPASSQQQREAKQRRAKQSKRNVKESKEQQARIHVPNVFRYAFHCQPAASSKEEQSEGDQSKAKAKQRRAKQRVDLHRCLKRVPSLVLLLVSSQQPTARRERSRTHPPQRTASAPARSTSVCTSTGHQRQR